jgi:predicted O-linked N-acetylglucosamine transferase (SPINDLY family)
LLQVLVDDLALQKKSAEIFTHFKFGINPTLGLIPKYTKKEKIRIGYFSADFHSHATGYLMAELFELHDRDQI